MINNNSTQSNKTQQSFSFSLSLSPHSLSLLSVASPSINQSSNLKIISVFFCALFMDNFRSKSCRDGRNMQIEIYNGGGSRASSSGAPPTGMNDLRCYSASYANSGPPPPPSSSYNNMAKDVKIKKSKKDFESKSKSWSFNDPELQRKKRVAGYKVYAVEGKMKGSFRKSFRWMKDRYTQVVYGWW